MRNVADVISLVLLAFFLSVDLMREHLVGKNEPL